MIAVPGCLPVAESLQAMMSGCCGGHLGRAAPAIMQSPSMAAVLFPSGH
jgi:hypothetical protein